MSEWTRYCEAGSCVEHRTVDGKVFFRNSSDEDRMLEFTAAQWDTFVAGLTAQVAAERDEARKAATEAAGACMRAQAEILAQVMRWDLKWTDLTAERDKLGQDYVRVMAERDNMAAENARLRQEVDRYKGWLATANKELNEAEADRDRYAAAATETFRQMNAAIAEAAVLRGRDRRTPEVRRVVEEAETLVAVWQDGGNGIGKALIDAVERYWKATETGPKSTLPAEQPQPVAQPTGGPEPQGEAQRADWTAENGVSNSSSEFKRIRAEIERLIRDDAFKLIAGRAGDTAGLILAQLAHRHGLAPTTSHIREQINESSIQPRVWNAGDPEPEGVEKVRDSDGDEWQPQHGLWVCYERATGDEIGICPWHFIVRRYGPLTEVLPEPTPYDGPVLAGDQVLGEFAKPDGEVPEAGRAGEAQTKDQDRTEVGLDAAIEAALPAFRQVWIEWGRPLRSCIEAAVRAASPLIERAALERVIAKIEGTVMGTPNAAVRLGIDRTLDILRASATRTETP